MGFAADGNGGQRVGLRELENDATANWAHFTAADFERLKSKYGVTWVILENPGVPGLTCPYTNSTVQVCRIP